MLHAIRTYAMVTTDSSLLKKSSSGGVFSLLAEDVIRKGGTVFGAAFSDDFKAVRHIPVHTIDDLGKLRGSKYLRSNITESFALVQELLEQGTDVLFSGTPCQISALKKILKKDYSNLLTVAVICHGTPKSAIWRDYITELEAKYCSKAMAVNFRDKGGSRVGKYRLCVRFANGKQYCKTKDRDIYMCGFLQNVTLEKSCFDCHFKGNNIECDVILGDFWGVEHILPEFNSHSGTSLVIVRSEKGAEATKALLSRTKYKEVDVDLAVSKNSSLLCSAPKSVNYDGFWQTYDEKHCKKSIQKFLNRKNYIVILKNKLNRVLKQKHIK